MNDDKTITLHLFTHARKTGKYPEQFFSMFSSQTTLTAIFDFCPLVDPGGGSSIGGDVFRSDYLSQPFVKKITKEQC